MMTISGIIWLIYSIGMFIAFLFFSDDAYEESWRLKIRPEEYLGRGDVLMKILLCSIGSWIAIFLRWQKKL